MGFLSWLLFGYSEATFGGFLFELSSLEDWAITNEIADISTDDHGLSLISEGGDPYLISHPTSFSSSMYKAIVVEMSVEAGTEGQLFWLSDGREHFSEPVSERFTIKADGQFHRYWISLARHPHWRGEVTRLRLDPSDAPGRIRVRSMQVWDRAGAVIEPVSFHPKSPLGGPISLHLRNVGDMVGEVTATLRADESHLSVPDPMDLIRFLTIPPGEEAKTSWDLSSIQGYATIVCEWEVDPRGVREPGPRDGTQTTVLRHSEMGFGARSDVLLVSKDNQRGASLFIVDGVILWHWRGEETYDAALSPRLGTVIYQLDDGSMEIEPILTNNARVRDQSTVIFFHEWRDRDGRNWRVETDIHVDDAIDNLIRVQTRLRSNGGRVLRFSGPMLYASTTTGEDFRSGMMSANPSASLLGSRYASFPGVEYLGPGDLSSSDAVARPPVRDQFVPNYDKVTIPYMAMADNGYVLGLLWPANAQWGDHGRHYAPMFASPNRLQRQENDLMGLFIPPPPDYGLENRELASNPYVIGENEALTMEYAVYLAPGDDPNNALDVWLQAYGEGAFPQPESAPRSYEEQIAVSRLAYTDTCWDVEKRGWGHCVGWDAHPSGGMLALLDIDARLASGADVQSSLRDQIRLVYDHIVATQGPFGLGRNTGCHIMVIEPVFHWGVAEATLDYWRKRARDFQSTQNPDGSWGFRPGKEEQRELGDEGEVVSGTISRNAVFMMELARITADPVAVEVGLKAVKALNRFRVPQGAQGWECPLASPDIMVSAQGARANLDAYKITGDEGYLEQAVYWARTGLPFIYLWNHPETPLQRYATIPIYGASFFHHNWRGVPVQWCGLDYAYSLQMLSQYDETYPWLKIARGIVNSGMLQQLTEGPYAGTLPDSYIDRFSLDRGPYINPENIMTNLYALEGDAFWIDSWFPGERATDALRVSANAAIGPGAEDGGRLNFIVRSPTGRLTEILVAPLDEKPARVLRAGVESPQRETLFEAAEGWRYIPEHRALLIHVTHDEEEVAIRVD